MQRRWKVLTLPSDGLAERRMIATVCEFQNVLGLAA
jgi:hypothetical protein